MFDFNNKTALVTGATSGIGLAIAQTLGQSGAHVLVNSENEAACVETVEQLQAEGYKATALTADMSDRKSVADLVQKIESDYPNLDCMFINAGITGNKKFGDEGYDENANLVFDINIHAPRSLCDNLLPLMAKQGKGSVVLTSSLSGLRGNKNIGVYSLTKAAVAQLARDMAVKFGPDGIRVNSISPGLIATGWEQNILANPKAAEQRLQMTPLRRIGEPQEIANVAAFLASDLASFVTGHNLVADGGTVITDGN
jgi:NAD(P)-dependent dehydrogenase (short-subunit alcohol dehydrogenase family)